MRITLTAIALIVWSGCAFAQTFTATQLGLLPGGTYTAAAAINNAGQVVGDGDNIINGTPVIAAAIWNGTTPTILARSQGYIGAYGINNYGIVVGVDGSPNHPFAAAWVGSVQHELFDEIFAIALGINDSGEIVGNAVCPVTCPGSPLLMTRPTATSFITLPTLEGPNPVSIAQGISAGGEIVGYSITTTNPNDGSYNVYHATLWTGPYGANVSDLGTLGGTNGAAAAINASGRIVGWADTVDGSQHAALWHRRKVIDLGTLEGNTSSASGINDKGYIVGSAETKEGVLHAVLWVHARSKPIDLNVEIEPKLGTKITLTEAVGINDKCVIIANGTNNKTGEGVSFVLSPKHSSNCNRCDRSDGGESQSEQQDWKDRECEHYRD